MSEEIGVNASSGQTMVVGVDGSPAARGAAVWASALASCTGTPLRLVHALPEPLYRVSDVTAMGQAPAIAQARKVGEMMLGEATTAVRLRFPDLDVRTDLVPGPTAPALTACGAAATMIVVGADDPRGVGALATGSTAIHLVKHSTCPITVWRGQPGTLPDHRPVVVGVDPSGSSAAAVLSAFEFAHLCHTPVIAVYGWSTRHSAGDVTIPLLVDWEALDESERAVLAAQLAEAKRRYPDVAVTAVVEPKNPAQLITDQAADAQLVVVGSHGRGRFTGAILGSVSQHLLHHSPGPIMIHRGAHHGNP
ncbi:MULTISPECIES: universal stress protein [Rhodococcus]|uniref:Usp family protein n=1 Tax=Rhodococcus opacus RKJ300 = JCM 13270 TaxID=1165867 RepID=I0WPD4_RHOOP|nr:universal stress protein [Rhodococcus opacus]EID78250.1 Usp family protein [Rhodococcus opacus RKJ300 = JCM 13270]